MMRYVSIRNLAPLCGVILGLLVLCNTASTNILRASDDAGGGIGPQWWVVAIGSTCGGTTQLHCSNGQTYGAQNCGGGWFQGVAIGSGGTVQPYPYPYGSYAYCTSSGGLESANCNSVMQTYCQF